MPFMAWTKAIPHTSKGFSQENKLRPLKDTSNFWAEARKTPGCPITAMNDGVSHFHNKKTLAFSHSLSKQGAPSPY